MRLGKFYMRASGRPCRELQIRSTASSTLAARAKSGEPMLINKERAIDFARRHEWEKPDPWYTKVYTHIYDQCVNNTCDPVTEQLKDDFGVRDLFHMEN